MTEQFDIVVVGAGLAGLEVTRALSATGRSVLLVDAKPSLKQRVHTTGIFVRRTLEDFQFPEDCLGPVVRDISLYAPNGSSLAICSNRDEFRVGKMGTLYEKFLTQCTALGAEVRLNTIFDGTQTGTPWSTVQLRSAGATYDVQCRYLIGADGVQSCVAKSLRLSENRRWIVGLEKVYESAKSATSEPRFHCLIDPVFAPGYIAWVVDDGEDVHVGVGGDPKQFDPQQALPAFEAWAAEHVEYNVGELIERRGGSIPIGGLLPEVANQFGMLIGDASGAVSPLTAGGLDPCLRLSRSAAVIADEFLRTGDLSGLARYNGRKIRQRFWKRLLLRQCLELCRSRALINLGWRGLDSHVGRTFARRLFFGRGSFPDVLPVNPVVDAKLDALCQSAQCSVE